MLGFSVLAVMGCLAVSLCQATCPTPHLPEQHFDLPKIAGSWLVTYNFPNPGQENCKCNSLTVTEESLLGEAILTSGCYNTGSNQFELRYTYVDEVESNGKIVGKVLDREGNLRYMDFYLAATDYENYAVLYSCSESGEYATILSRNGYTSPDVKAAVDKAMMKHGVNPSKFIPVIQDCYNF